MYLTLFKQFNRRNVFNCDQGNSDHPAGKVLTIKQATPCTTVKRQKLQKSISRLEALVEAKTQANNMIH